MQRIKAFSDKLAIPASSIRYYEKKGLLETKRTENKYRVYDGDDEQRLKLILVMKYSGFSIKEIKELLSFSNTPDEEDCIKRTNDLLLTKREELLVKIANYQKIIDLLDLMRPLAIAEVTEETTKTLNDLVNLIFDNNIEEE